ncbi:MAG: ABC transporter permease [Vicinamibacteria bacterium]|jgi:putative ABC transport system permease protein|nr:ABC transporter permease [Vicinamibacteria bacterium]MBP9945263.1 ABC transporter permease [Vicinamibacteria bacterium]
MNSLSFLKQMAHDVRHQKMRTALTVLGITWGTVSVALLVAFGEGLQGKIQQQQAGLGENIVIAWPSRTSLPYQGLGKGRRILVNEEDIQALRREIPEASFSGEFSRQSSSFKREKVRLTPDMSANSPIFAVMRNVIPAEGGRYINDLDMDRRRRVVFIGDKLKTDLFGDSEAVGQTIMIDNTPFLVVGVLQKKGQDSSYGGRDEDKAFIPETSYRGLFTERNYENLIFQAKSAEMTPVVTEKVYETLARRHKFDPKDKEAIGMWDTTEGAKFFKIFFGIFRGFLAIVGSFTLIVGGIGVSNIMYVVLEERMKEIGIKLAIGAKPRFIQTQFLLETLTITAIGGALGFLITLGVMAIFPYAGLDEYVGTPKASPLVLLSTSLLLGLIGFIAGYFPARRASMLDPVVALKLG